jgi:anion-transporting  ArsA/GET3 family ATPase
MTVKPLQFVVGKGGVGKSTLTAALALAAVEQGHRVLAVELGGAGGLARIFEREPEPSGGTSEVRERLTIACIEGDVALAEYLELVVPIKRLLAGVFASRIYRYFVAAAPGLKELMTVGKIWYEAQKEGPGGRPLWDVIVVDAGASGHSLQYLQMPTAAARTFKSGLVHRESTRVEALLKDRDTTAIHVLATPEDMPITEAVQIVERLRGDLGLPLGGLFVNRCRRSSPAGAAEALDVLAASDLGRDGPGADPSVRCARDGVVAAGRRSLAWEQIQERSIDRLARETGSTPFRLPLLASEEFGLPEVQELARVLIAGRMS